MFSLFPRKSASALLFRETVQTQYLNKIRGAQKKRYSVEAFFYRALPFSSFPSFVFFPKTALSVCCRAASAMPASIRFEDSIERSDASKDPSHRNSSESTWPSPRGASRRPDSNRRAWPQAPGAGGRGVPKTLVQGEAFATLCVCVGGGAGCWEGKAHVGKRGIAWRLSPPSPRESARVKPKRDFSKIEDDDGSPPGPPHMPQNPYLPP